MNADEQVPADDVRIGRATSVNHRSASANDIEDKTVW
jgi:hypothetical protein